MSDLLIQRMILNVRDWLKNGCDPAYAVLELESIAARMNADQPARAIIQQAKECGCSICDACVAASQPSDARAEVWRKAHQDHCTMGSGCPYRDEAWVESLVRAADQQSEAPVGVCDCDMPAPATPGDGDVPWCYTCGGNLTADNPSAERQD
jgi:hypothetical protein